MSEPSFTPRHIDVDNDAEVMRVDWADGHQSRIPITRLRGYCPCAECQGHGGPIAWHDNHVTGISHAEMVGRYAVLLVFADGHDTGIFRWDYLRKLDPEERSRWGEPENFGRATP